VGRADLSESALKFLAVDGGIITYAASGAQRIAVAVGFTMVAWPTKPVTAKVVTLDLDNAAASK
jgi:alcohol dehydrogenase (cytochrome c)